MFLSKIKFLGGVSLITLLWIHPAFSEMSMSERSLPADTVIKDSFQAGTGLPVGKIQSVRGEAFIFHRDPSVGYRAKTGLPLYQGDILHTRKNSWVLCRLVDRSRLAMAPGTMLTLLLFNSNSARKSSLSFLSLKQGGIRLYVSGTPEPFFSEFKVQTETAYILAKAADFIVKADPGQTEIFTFEKSRLEVTSLAEPEEIHYLSDYQRTVVKPESAEPVVETMSPGDSAILTAEFRLTPDSKLFASGANNYRGPDTPDASIED
ncbi:MAG: FecR family protein [Desulfobacterales bacterium]